MSDPGHAFDPESPQDVAPEHRPLSKRAADVCRADPATCARIVRHTDHLQAACVGPDEALDQAMRRWSR